MIDYVEDYNNSRLAEEYIRSQKPVTRSEQESILKYIKNIYGSIYGSKSNKNLDNYINDNKMITNEKEFAAVMNQLFNELINSQDKKTDKKILAKAAMAGIQYQEYKIKSGIDVVFNELHKK